MKSIILRITLWIVFLVFVFSVFRLARCTTDSKGQTLTQAQYKLEQTDDNRFVLTVEHKDILFKTNLVSIITYIEKSYSIEQATNILINASHASLKRITTDSNLNIRLHIRFQQSP